jgi:chromosome segregation ATPase
MTATTPFDCEAIRGKFRQWQVEQEPIAAQLSESLSALSAYQSHLDAWQQQLAQERGELLAARQQLEKDRSAAGASESRMAESATELNAARDKIAALSASLLARTEELRTLDNRRGEVVTELELARARENDLRRTLEELRHTRDQERAQWAEESRHLRELLERRLEGGDQQVQETAGHPRVAERPNTIGPDRTADNAVFASVMEQFGKLRQQRASERPTSKKAR